jgi:hypothetical protein
MVSSDETAETLITLGLAMLREGAFMHAHEHFERCWRTSLADERTLFHALAQLAASHYQLAQGRARAAVRSWQKARTKLAAVGALAPEFQQAMETFHAALEIGEEGPRFLDVKRLPPFEGWPCPRRLPPFLGG